MGAVPSREACESPNTVYFLNDHDEVSFRLPMTPHYFPSADCLAFQQLIDARNNQSPKYKFDLRSVRGLAPDTAAAAFRAAQAEDWGPEVDELDPSVHYYDAGEDGTSHGSWQGHSAAGQASAGETAAGPCHLRGSIEDPAELYDALVRAPTASGRLVDTNAEMCDVYAQEQRWRIAQQQLRDYRESVAEETTVTPPAHIVAAAAVPPPRSFLCPVPEAALVIMEMSEVAEVRARYAANHSTPANGCSVEKNEALDARNRHGSHGDEEEDVLNENKILSYPVFTEEKLPLELDEAYMDGRVHLVEHEGVNYVFAYNPDYLRSIGKTVKNDGSAIRPILASPQFRNRVGKPDSSAVPVRNISELLEPHHRGEMPSACMTASAADAHIPREPFTTTYEVASRRAENFTDRDHPLQKRAYELLGPAYEKYYIPILPVRVIGMDGLLPESEQLTAARQRRHSSSCTRHEDCSTAEAASSVAAAWPGPSPLLAAATCEPSLRSCRFVHRQRGDKMINRLAVLGVLLHVERCLLAGLPEAIVRPVWSLYAINDIPLLQFHRDLGLRLTTGSAEIKCAMDCVRDALEHEDRWNNCVAFVNSPMLGYRVMEPPEKVFRKVEHANEPPPPPSPAAPAAAARGGAKSGAGDAGEGGRDRWWDVNFGRRMRIAKVVTKRARSEDSAVSLDDGDEDGKRGRDEELAVEEGEGEHVKDNEKDASDCTGCHSVGESLSLSHGSSFNATPRSADGQHSSRNIYSPVPRTDAAHTNALPRSAATVRDGASDEPTRANSNDGTTSEAVLSSPASDAEQRFHRRFSYYSDLDLLLLREPFHHLSGIHSGVRGRYMLVQYDADACQRVAQVLSRTAAPIILMPFFGRFPPMPYFSFRGAIPAETASPATPTALALSNASGRPASADVKTRVSSASSHALGNSSGSASAALSHSSALCLAAPCSTSLPSSIACSRAFVSLPAPTERLRQRVTGAYSRGTICCFSVSKLRESLYLSPPALNGRPCCNAERAMAAAMALQVSARYLRMLIRHIITDGHTDSGCTPYLQQSGGPAEGDGGQAGLEVLPSYDGDVVVLCPGTARWMPLRSFQQLVRLLLAEKSRLPYDAMDPVDPFLCEGSSAESGSRAACAGASRLSTAIGSAASGATSSATPAAAAAASPIVTDKTVSVRAPTHTVSSSVFCSGRSPQAVEFNICGGGICCCVSGIHRTAFANAADSLAPDADSAAPHHAAPAAGTLPDIDYCKLFAPALLASLEGRLGRRLAGERKLYYRDPFLLTRLQSPIPFFGLFEVLFVRATLAMKDPRSEEKGDPYWLHEYAADAPHSFSDLQRLRAASESAGGGNSHPVSHRAAPFVQTDGFLVRSWALCDDAFDDDDDNDRRRNTDAAPAQSHCARGASASPGRIPADFSGETGRHLLFFYASKPPFMRRMATRQRENKRRRKDKAEPAVEAPHSPPAPLEVQFAAVLAPPAWTPSPMQQQQQQQQQSWGAPTGVLGRAPLDGASSAGRSHRLRVVVPVEEMIVNSSSRTLPMHNDDNGEPVGVDATADGSLPRQSAAAASRMPRAYRGGSFHDVSLTRPPP